MLQVGGIRTSSMKISLQPALRRIFRKSTHWTRHLASRYSNVGSTVVSPGDEQGSKLLSPEEILAHQGRINARSFRFGLRGLAGRAEVCSGSLDPILENAVEHLAALGASAAKLSVGLSLTILDLMELVGDMQSGEDRDL
ncbi:MAG: hypothetical protein JFAIHJKO_02188 [Pyrinomonadaceae bacterium]|nr:hypothetical protein [Pyrinomonadaceae bacterium]